MKTKIPPRPPAIPPNYNCAICDVEWPEQLMVLRTVGKVEDRICCPCHDRAKKEAALKSQQKNLGRYTIGTSMMPALRFFGWIALAVVVGAGLIYGSYLLIGTYREKAKEGVSILGPKDVTGTIVVSQLPLKSGKSVVGSAFFVKGPTEPLAVMPAAVVFNQDPKHPEVPVFDQWTFNTLGEKKEVIKVAGVRQKVDAGAGNTFWLVAGEKKEDQKLPVTVLEPLKVPAGPGFRLRMVRLTTGADGTTTQISSNARVEAAFAGGANLTVALPARLSSKGLIGSPLISESGELVGVVTGVGEPPDADGTVRFLAAISADELLGIHPPAPKPMVAPKVAAAATPKKSKTSIIPGGNPYDKPEYDGLK